MIKNLVIRKNNGIAVFAKEIRKDMGEHVHLITTPKQTPISVVILIKLNYDKNKVLDELYDIENIVKNTDLNKING